jgi:hypothetical protein
MLEEFGRHGKGGCGRVFFYFLSRMVVKQKIKQGNDECKLENAKKYRNEGKYKERQNKPAIRLGISK